MRPKTKVYTPAAEDDNFFIDDGTGASLTLLQTATPDGLAHQLSFTSAANLSGITFTVVGTNADGFAVTEAVTGPNATTVESTSFFKTVTSITPGATLGANTIDIGFVDEIQTPVLVLEPISEEVRIQINVTGTINFTLQETNSDLRGTTAFDYVTVPDALAGGVDVSAVTATVVAVLDPPPAGVRILTGSYSAGASLELEVVHSRR